MLRGLANNNAPDEWNAALSECANLFGARYLCRASMALLPGVPIITFKRQHEGGNAVPR